MTALCLTFAKLYRSTLQGLQYLNQLALGKNRFSGTLCGSALARLTQLKEIFLNDNFLSGAIAPEIGYLTSLTRLFLHKNLFQSPIPSFDSLPALEDFTLSDNLLQGLVPTTFLAKAKSSLKTLILHNNEEMEFDTPLLQEFTMLQYADLQVPSLPLLSDTLLLHHNACIASLLSLQSV